MKPGSASSSPRVPSIMRNAQLENSRHTLQMRISAFTKLARHIHLARFGKMLLIHVMMVLRRYGVDLPANAGVGRGTVR